MFIAFKLCDVVTDSRQMMLPVKRRTSFQNGPIFHGNVTWLVKYMIKSMDVNFAVKEIHAGGYHQCITQITIHDRWLYRL